MRVPDTRAAAACGGALCAARCSRPLTPARARAQAACIKEIGVAKNFDENWGYLRARPEECKPRAFETRLVKYFSNGVASVREKRLALEGEARGDTPPTPEEDKIRVDPELQAKAVAKSMFATSNYEYGSRGSLELFGVAQVRRFAQRAGVAVGEAHGGACAWPATRTHGAVASAAYSRCKTLACLLFRSSFRSVSRARNVPFCVRPCRISRARVSLVRLSVRLCVVASARPCFVASARVVNLAPAAI